MKTRILMVIAVLMALGMVLRPGVRAGETEADAKSLLFVAYPDGSNWLTAEVLRRLGGAYENANPHVKIEVRHRTGYGEARRSVLSGEAAGMMIEEDANHIRAYITAEGGNRRNSRKAHELKLDRFVPIAVRTIRGEDGAVAAEMRLGIATDRISNELARFLDFLSTVAAEQALAGLPDISPAEPADEPRPVKQVHGAHGFQWPEPRDLEQPILTY